MTIITLGRFVMAVVLFSVALSLGSAWGADTMPKQTPAPDQTNVNVSDKDLRAFAKAYVEYQKIRQDYEPKLTNTRDEKERLKIQREGDDKVKQALDKQGLSPQSYNRIFVAVNGNPQLRQKALALIGDERKKS